MKPHFFSQGLRLNSEGYIDLMKTVVKPWIFKVANGRPYVWQQASAPCHISNVSQRWLANNLKDYTNPNNWPPNSPDCNPFNFYLWGKVERETNQTSCNTMDDLMKRITMVFKSLAMDQVRTTCSRFRPWLEKIIKAEGNYFK